MLVINLIKTLLILIYSRGLIFLFFYLLKDEAEAFMQYKPRATFTANPRTVLYIFILLVSFYYFQFVYLRFRSSG
jgi:cytochrome c oxidase assembly factor CtaG